MADTTRPGQPDSRPPRLLVVDFDFFFPNPLQERVKELTALDAILARLDDEPGDDYVAGAGATALPIAQIRPSQSET